jgi:hypothetical protein
MLVQCDQGRDRGEAQLEARARQRLGPEQQHDQAPTATRRRVSASRPSAMPPSTSSAAMHGAHGRHFGAGEEGVTDAGQRTRSGRDQHQRSAQAQRGAEGEQLEREQHDRADGGGQVKAADREEMCQARGAHRFGIGVGDRALIAGRERGGDRALPAAEPFAHMIGQALPCRGKAGAPVLLSGLCRHLDLAERTAGAADALEPGHPGEVERARHRRRRGRHQPGAQAHGGTGLEGGVAAFSSTLILSRGGKFWPAAGRTSSRTASRAGSFCTASIVPLNSANCARSIRGCATRSAFHQISPQPIAPASAKDGDRAAGPASRGERQGAYGEREAEQQKAGPCAGSGSANQARCRPRARPEATSGSWSRSASNSASIRVGAPRQRSATPVLRREPSPRVPAAVAISPSPVAPDLIRGRAAFPRPAKRRPWPGSSPGRR